MKIVHVLLYAGMIIFVFIVAGGCGKKQDGLSSSDTHQDSGGNEEKIVVTEIENTSRFSQIINQNEIVMVDFYADWCGPCRQLKPVIHDIARKFSGKAAVVAVNVDRLRELAIEYGISGIPDVRVFKGGSPVKQFVGVQPANIYSEYLRGITAE